MAYASFEHLVSLCIASIWVVIRMQVWCSTTHSWKARGVKIWLWCVKPWWDLGSNSELGTFRTKNGSKLNCCSLTFSSHFSLNIFLLSTLIHRLGEATLPKRCLQVALTPQIPNTCCGLVNCDSSLVKAWRFWGMRTQALVGWQLLGWWTHSNDGSRWSSHDL